MAEPEPQPEAAEGRLGRKGGVSACLCPSPAPLPTYIPPPPVPPSPIRHLLPPPRPLMLTSAWDTHSAPPPPAPAPVTKRGTLAQHCPPSGSPGCLLKKPQSVLPDPWASGGETKGHADPSEGWRPLPLSRGPAMPRSPYQPPQHPCGPDAHPSTPTRWVAGPKLPPFREPA